MRLWTLKQVVPKQCGVSQSHRETALIYKVQPCICPMALGRPGRSGFSSQAMSFSPRGLAPNPVWPDLLLIHLGPSEEAKSRTGQAHPALTHACSSSPAWDDFRHSSGLTLSFWKAAVNLKSRLSRGPAT